MKIMESKSVENTTSNKLLNKGSLCFTVNGLFYIYLRPRWNLSQRFMKFSTGLKQSADKIGPMRHGE